MFARHDLVWLTERGWQHALATAPAGCTDALDLWRREGWPATVRRSDAGLAPGQLSVGIALPPRAQDGAKTRIGLQVPAAQVHRFAPPLPVARAVDAAPAAWQPRLAALAGEAAASGLACRVYGSLALQALTRQTYVTAASDIDVLLHPNTPAQLQGGLALLHLHAGALPLDGEIVFPRACAVAWKEWSGAARAGAGARVLVKEIDRVSLATTGALLATLHA